MANVSQIKLPNNSVYDIKDNNALPLTGGTVTGPTVFSDSVSIDEATVGDLVVNGAGSFTNNLQVNTINGVTVGTSPKFTDSDVSTLTLASGSTAGTSLTHGGKFTLTAGTKTVSFTMPSDNNTTYTFANGTNGFTVTPSGGTAQTVTVTPSITNNITGSGTANKVPKFTAANTIGDGYGVTDNSTSTAVTSTDTNLITARTLYYAGYTKNTGTITGVTAGTGMSGGGTSGSVTLNHSNSVTAQTTQAVYPIKIDAQGHISAYGSAVTIPVVPSNLVNTVTTTAGAHTAITSATGNVSFNVPTKTSHLTNDSGFITSDSDKKLEIGSVTSGTQYYPIVGTGTTAATRQYDTTGFQYKGTNGTTSAVGSSILTLGNSTASGTANNKQGQLVIYGSTAYAHTISGAPTAARTLTLPNATGTLALTSQIPSVPTSATNSTTGISISDHGTTSVGSASNWSAGTASSWTFEEKSIPNVTSAGTASSWTFEEKSIPNVTAAGSGSFTQGSFSGGSGSFSATVTNHVLSFSHTHTAATHGADSHTHTAPTIGTAIKVQSKSGGSNGTAPTLGTAIKVQSKSGGSNSTVPSLTITSTTVVNGKTHSITDNGHTHTLS